MSQLTCPFCNALLPALEPAARPVCPRCGEQLPASYATAITATAPPAEDLPAPVATTARFGNRTVRGVVLGVMAAMAILSATYAWTTVNFRRQRDPRMPQATQPETAHLPAPADWPALGWLPPETGLVLGLHVAAAQNGPASGEVLKKLKIGANGAGGAELENWTGLALADIDHAVLGFKVEQRIIPPFVLVVRTRTPYDLAKVRASLKAERSSDVGQKTVYHFTPRGAKLSFDVMLWPADPNTLVVCMTRADLESISATPKPGAAHLPAGVQALLKERLDPGAQAWLVGSVTRWDPLGPLLGLLLTKEAQETLAKIRNVAFSLQVDPGVKLRGAVTCSDEPALAALAEKWAQLSVPEANVPKEFVPVFRELAETYHTERRDGWLLLDAQTKPETLSQAVKP